LKHKKYTIMLGGKMKKNYYCENCGEEGLKTYIELYDGTIVCSPKCRKEWKQNCKENRKNE
jgi:formylmethanofuran dehydrogenase subunit E